MSNDRSLVVPSGSLVVARFWSCTPHSKRLFLCILNIVSYGFGNTRGQGPRLSIRPTGSNIFVFVRDVTHVQTCEKKPCFFFRFFGVIPETCPNLVMAFVFKVLRNRLLRYRVETCPVSRPVMAFLFKVLRNRLLRYRLGTCPKPVMTFVFKVPRNRLLRADLKHVQCPDLWWRSCSKCYANRLLRYRLGTCPNLWWRLCSKCYANDCFVQTWQHVQCPDLWWRSCSKCYATDCFGTDLEHVQTCDDVCVQSATQSTASCRLDNMSSVQTCDGVPVQSATQPTASVHTWNMSKPVMTFVVRVQSATQSTASVLDTCSKPVITFMAVSHMFGIFLGPWWRMLCNPVKTMYILYIMTKYLWELRDSERARPRTRNVVV